MLTELPPFSIATRLCFKKKKKGHKTSCGLNYYHRILRANGIFIYFYTASVSQDHFIILCLTIHKYTVKSWQLQNWIKQKKWNLDLRKLHALGILSLVSNTGHCAEFSGKCHISFLHDWHLFLQLFRVFCI